MKASCGIVQDLLPLHVDEICSEASRKLVEEHLEECAHCKAQYEAMRVQTSTYAEDTKEMKFVEGLTKLKNRIGRRMRSAIACSAAAIIAIVLLFNLPLKTLGLEDFKVSANMYSMDELAKMGPISDGETSVQITRSEDDAGEMYQVVIPSMPNAEISLSENTMEDTQYITVINWSSPYILRQINWDIEEDDETLYVQAVKTTFLNNRVADDYATDQSIKTLEMRRISKIVYVDDDGRETVLWQESRQQAPAEITVP